MTSLLADFWSQSELGQRVIIITKLFQIVTNQCKSDQIGGIYYQNQDRFITYSCQKDNEHQENWTKWELGLHISKSEPLL